MAIKKITVPPDKLAAAINKYLIPALIQYSPDSYEKPVAQKEGGKKSNGQRNTSSA